MKNSESVYDLIIAGAGPAGLSSALNAHQNNLKYILLEKTDHLADTIYCYQKGKFVMAEPAPIPLRGELWLNPSLREDLLDHWNQAAQEKGLNIAMNSPVTSIIKEDGLFQVKTDRQMLKAKQVIIAMGNQGNPRKLGVPGDELPHVLPRLIDPAMYSGKDILVVGGGDSAIEIAVALSEQNRVSMAVRTPEFIRVKDSLERQALEKAKKGELTIYFNSTVEQVERERVKLKLPRSNVDVKAQVVIVKIGAIPPRSFLEKCGIAFPSQDREATPLLSTSYETNVPGLFLIGAVGGKELIKHAINQGYEAVEHLCGRPVEPADEALLRQKLGITAGTVSGRIQELIPMAPVLSGGTEAQIRELLLSSQFHRVQPGEIVFRQNDFSESLYTILEGRVELLVKPDDGPEKSVATLGPGEFLGEMSLISGRRRSATVRAVSEGYLWEVARKAMLKFIHTTPSARKFIDQSFLIHAFQSYLFPNLDHAVLARLAGQAEVVKFEKGKVIIKEGDPGDAFYLLRSGMVKVSKVRDEREVVLAYLAAGQYFGEMALLNNAPRAATVTAIDKVEVIKLLREDFLDFLTSSRELKERIQEEIRRRQLGNIEVELRPELSELGQFMVSQEVVVGDNVLLIDEHKCVDCDYCVKACESVHEDSQTRIKRVGIKFANILVPNSCRHCENPLCMTDCPPGDAIVRDPRGEVYIRGNCIGCGNCASNCPYENIFMVHPEEKTSLWGWAGKLFRSAEPNAPKTAEGVGKALAVKCDLCRGIDGGPACVRSCPTGAVIRLKPNEYFERIQSMAFKG